jgi:hypothetical protein
MIQSPCFVSLNGSADEPATLPIATGQTVLHAPSSTFVRADGAGTTHLSLTGIPSLTFAPGAAVSSYRIQHDSQSIHHSVRFAVGGEFVASYDRNGQLVELRGESLRLIKNADGLVVGPLRA